MPIYDFHCPVVYRCWVSPTKCVHITSHIPLAYWSSAKGVLGPLTRDLIADLTLMWSISETPSKLPGCLMPTLDPEAWRQVLALIQNNGQFFHNGDHLLDDKAKISDLIAASPLIREQCKAEALEMCRELSRLSGLEGEAAQTTANLPAAEIKGGMATHLPDFALELDIKPPGSTAPHDDGGVPGAVEVHHVTLDSPVIVRCLLDPNDPTLALVQLRSYVSLSVWADAGCVPVIKKQLLRDVEAYLVTPKISKGNWARFNPRGQASPRGSKLVSSPMEPAATAGGGQQLLSPGQLKELDEAQKMNLQKPLVVRIMKHFFKPYHCRYVLAALHANAKFYAVRSEVELPRNFKLNKLLHQHKTTPLMVDLGRKDAKQEITILSYLDGANLQPEEISLPYHFDVATPRNIHYDLLARGLLAKKSHQKQASLMLNNGQEFVTNIQRSGLKFDSSATLAKLNLAPGTEISIKWKSSKFAPKHNAVVNVWHEGADRWLRVVVEFGANVLAVKKKIRKLVGPNYPVEGQTLILSTVGHSIAAGAVMKDEIRIPAAAMAGSAVCGRKAPGSEREKITLKKRTPPPPRQQESAATTAGGGDSAERGKRDRGDELA